MLQAFVVPGAFPKKSGGYLLDHGENHGFIIPSPVHTKHHLNDPNGMWKFPTKTMVSKGVFSIRGMGPLTINDNDMDNC